MQSHIFINKLEWFGEVFLSLTRIDTNSISDFTEYLDNKYVHFDISVNFNDFDYMIQWSVCNFRNHRYQ